MIVIKSPLEIEKLRRAGRKTAVVMAGLESMIKPGVTALELDRQAAELIAREGAKAAFKGYRGYPASICVSFNETVVHGVPRDRALKEGDIVGIDLGLVFDGFFGDMAKTFMIGQVEESVAQLVRVTQGALDKGIEQCVRDRRLGDVSHAIEKWVTQHGFTVVKDFVGHGIGTKLHEDPSIPNYGKPGTGPKLCVGMVLALEPMVNQGREEVRVLADGWTAVTKDGKPSAHFEHTVAITEGGPEILTRL